MGDVIGWRSEVRLRRYQKIDVVMSSRIPVGRVRVETSLARRQWVILLRPSISALS